MHMNSELEDSFPDAYDMIVDIQRQDEDFRELCRDYVTCIRHIDRLADEKVANFGLQKEFRTLCDSLRQEISKFLKIYQR
jgi:hypothetical protein